MIKILFFIFILTTGVFADTFGFLVMTPIVRNSILNNYEKKRILDIHKTLVGLTKSEIRKKRDDILVKYLNLKIKQDSCVENKLQNTVDSIVSNKSLSTQIRKPISSDIDDFKPMEDQKTSGKIMEITLDEIKKNCLESDDKEFILDLYNNDNKVIDSIGMDAIFALSYEYDYIKKEDKEYLTIYIFYSNTKKEKGSLILQWTNKRVDITSSDNSNDIAASLYKIIAKKVESLVHAEHSFFY